MGDNRPGIVYSNGSPRWSQPALARAILADTAMRRDAKPPRYSGSRLVFASPGQSLEGFCKDLVMGVWFVGPVIGIFNDIRLNAKPGSTTQGLIKQWQDLQRGYTRT